MLLRLSDRQVPRGVQFRALRWPRRASTGSRCRTPRSAIAAYSTLDHEQIPRVPRPVVADVDDPVFTPREVELLNDPNVKAYVVTAERAARRYEEIGVPSRTSSSPRA